MKRAKKGCDMPGCDARCSHHKTFCDACTSWWYRMTTKTPEELLAYMKKQNRMSHRIEYWRSYRRKRAA